MAINMGLPGPRARSYVERDEVVMSPSYTRSYPFVMDHGRGAEVWDVDGNRFVDFTAGIAVAATGHSHPDVVQAIKDQADKFLHMAGTDFYYSSQTELAERLVSLVPGDFPKQVFFTNSGTEAIEAAFKLSRYTSYRIDHGRLRAIAFIGSFHGRSYGALSLTGSKAIHRSWFAPLVPTVSHVPYGYCYRCAFNLEYPSCDIACIDYIEKTLFTQLFPGSEVAAIFVEPIQGEGGYVVPPPEYHPRLRELTEKYGILLVADEIQTGIGRTGKMFAMEHWGVVPDIVCLAKGIASGLPLGAMVAKKSLMTWDPGAHGNTFGGNPLACVAALETLRLVEEGYMENAATMGQRILDRLEVIKEEHPTVGDVRGKGLMIGIELVLDKKTKEPAKDLRDQVIQEAFKRGLLIVGCGMSAVRFMPPLCITADLVDEGLAIFEEALTEAEARL